MKAYSIDTNARQYVYAFIGILSVLITSQISYFENSLVYRYAAPSVVMIYFGIVKLFDLYLWRIYLLSNIPDLSGKWEGEIITSSRIHKPLTIRIKQTWTKLEVDFQSVGTISQVVVANMNIQNKETITLKYIYTVKGRTYETKHLFGEGTQEFRLIYNRGERYLEGIYYSTKYRGGAAKVKFIASNGI